MEVIEKQIRARYTLEFKQEAVRQVKDGRAAALQAPGGCWATNACFGDGPYSLCVEGERANCGRTRSAPPHRPRPPSSDVGTAPTTTSCRPFTRA